MMERYAVRNLRLCTKDCLCLYVCPTGATDTENSIIDKDKCIGCAACADACPSSAISMVPVSYPKAQAKDEETIGALRNLILDKAAAEMAAPDSVLGDAIIRSSRLMAEDLAREAGYMLPQNPETKKLLERIAKDPGAPDAAKRLLSSIAFHESETWKCAMCGYEHKGPKPEEPCPRCGAAPSEFYKTGE